MITPIEGAASNVSADEDRKERAMDENQKKTALRMIPYGLYVLTAQAKDGATTAATVNWVTQASFAPPLVVTAVKADSNAYAVIRSSGNFALNFLGKGQQAVAYNFFKSVEREGQTIGGERYRVGVTGAPILEATPAFVECRVVHMFDHGDHSIVVGEVVEAGVAQEPEGRPDDAVLWLKDLGARTFYGG
jgi:flavin reductase (DIM6/NTAB) family NADH-FMN oxidoreductase RutF